MPHLLAPKDETGKTFYARVMPCPRCTSPAELCQLLNISSRNATFENFKVKPGTKRAFEAAKALASFKTPWKLLLIYGINGNGKTHLLEAMSNHFLSLGMWQPVTSFPSLMGRLKGTFDRTKDKEDSGTFEDIIKLYCTNPILLLDDVGAAGSYTDFSRQQFERILLERYKAPLFTAITTNKNLEDLPRVVYSRFGDTEKARMVLNEGLDYRPEKNKENKKAGV